MNLARRLRRVLRTTTLATSLVYHAGRAQFLVILVSSIVMSVAVAVQLLVGRTLLEMLTDDTGVDAGDLAPWLVLLGVLMLASAISQSVSTEMRITLSERVLRLAMGDVLDVAAEVPLEAFEEPAFHDRLQRARMAAGDQSSTVVWGLVTIFTTLVVTIGVVAVLFTVAPVLVPIALLGYIPIAIVNVRNNRARYQLELELTELERDRMYMEFLLTERNEAKEIRSYGLAPTIRGWHHRLWDRRMVRLNDLVRRRLVLSSAGSFITTLVLIGTLSIAFVLAARGTISIADAAVAIVGLQQLSSRVQSLGTAFGSVHEGMVFLRDFEQFRAELPVLRERRPTGVPPSPPHTIAVENVSYRYPNAEQEAVRDVSFTLGRGQVMAIVGANGSGKSTLAKVLSQLYTPTGGRVTWDGVDTNECDPSLVRSQIAPVFQDFARFYFRIRDGIALGDVDRLDDEVAIRRAATLAGLDEVIAEQREGLDVRLGKLFFDGIDLSLGQWQRLAIARALFREAPIVVMDEPSASLDPRAEAELFDLLQSLGDDRIVIFVSHRFATVRSADVVLVLEQGEIVEMGSHTELMAADGLYHDLFVLQAERYGLER